MHVTHDRLICKKSGVGRATRAILKALQKVGDMDSVRAHDLRWLDSAAMHPEKKNSIEHKILLVVISYCNPVLDRTCGPRPELACLKKF